MADSATIALVGFANGVIAEIVRLVWRRYFPPKPRRVYGWFAWATRLRIWAVRLIRKAVAARRARKG